MPRDIPIGRYSREVGVAYEELEPRRVTDREPGESPYREAVMGSSAIVPHGSSGVLLHEFRHRDDEAGIVPQSLSVHATYELLSARQVADNMTGLKLRMVFGVGNVSHEAVFDFLRGISFCIPATSLRVSCDYASVTTGPDIKAKIMLTLGGRTPPAGNFARFTKTIGIVAAGTESTPIEIPNFATGVEIISTVAGDFGGNYLVRQWGGLSTSGVLIANTAPAAGEIIPIVSGGQGLSVSNAGTSTPTLIAVFHLAF